MEQILHLFITNKCRHDCEFCCNKLYDIEKIPVVTVELLKSVQTVCLTGGEPFGINPDTLCMFIMRLRKQYPNIENLYIYTSGYEASFRIMHIYNMMKRKAINGINIAPKDYRDWAGFVSIIDHTTSVFVENSSNRLYVFKEQQEAFDSNCDLSNINIDVIYRKWDKTFNTPNNEHFARLPILF